MTRRQWQALREVGLCVGRRSAVYFAFISMHDQSIVFAGAPGRTRCRTIHIVAKGKDREGGIVVKAGTECSRPGMTSIKTETAVYFCKAAIGSTFEQYIFTEAQYHQIK